MKKFYTTPAVVTSGDAVRETNASGPNPETGSPPGLGVAVGSVGYYL
jgi:hypothetical protein